MNEKIDFYAKKAGLRYFGALSPLSDDNTQFYYYFLLITLQFTSLVFFKKKKLVCTYDIMKNVLNNSIKCD